LRIKFSQKKNGKSDKILQKKKKKKKKGTQKKMERISFMCLEFRAFFVGRLNG